MDKLQAAVSATLGLQRSTDHYNPLNLLNNKFYRVQSIMGATDKRRGLGVGRSAVTAKSTIQCRRAVYRF